MDRDDNLQHSFRRKVFLRPNNCRVRSWNLGRGTKLEETSRSPWAPWYINLFRISKIKEKRTSTASTSRQYVQSVSKLSYRIHSIIVQNFFNFYSISFSLLSRRCWDFVQCCLLQWRWLKKLVLSTNPTLIYEIINKKGFSTDVYFRLKSFKLWSIRSKL